MIELSAIELSGRIVFDVSDIKSLLAEIVKRFSNEIEITSFDNLFDHVGNLESVVVNVRKRYSPDSARPA